MKRIISTFFVLLITFSFYAQDYWLNIYKSVDNIQRVVANPVSDISDISHIKSDNNAFDTMEITVNGEKIHINMDCIEKCVIGHNVPTIYIDTDEYVDEIPSKEYYLTATFSMKGYGNYDDIKATALNIKGRGNSTWGYAKKPYRLKFDKKISLCGLKKAKNYALIANYLDPTLMRNAVALKMAQLLDMPFTNHSVPVNVVLNGKYRGAYMLTEKIGLNAASVDVDDESSAILFELDSNYDELYKFKSPIYSLPVMVKDPDFDELVASDPSLNTEELLNKWQSDFNAMEVGIYNGELAEYFDINSVVNYLLVYLVTSNQEPNHPKSVYMYKESVQNKYKLGPVWDFDWAYTFNPNIKEGSSPTRVLLGQTLAGAKFFRKICQNEEFMTAFAQRWKYFRDDVWPLLKEYMSEYHDMIEVSALQNGEIWQENTLQSNVASSENFEEYYQKLLDFLETRINWIDTANNFGLY